MPLRIPLAAGTPIRLDTECPDCGWADMWQVTIHTLTAHGVGTAGTIARCARCGHHRTQKHR